MSGIMTRKVLNICFAPIKNKQRAARHSKNYAPQTCVFCNPGMVSSTHIFISVGLKFFFLFREISLVFWLIFCENS